MATSLTVGKLPVLDLYPKTFYPGQAGVITVTFVTA